MIKVYFDEELRQYTSFYSEGDGNLEMYQPTEKEKEEARRRRMIRSAAIGAGAAALVTGAGIMYLRGKGKGSISKGWRNVKTGWADKLSGGRISKLESANRDAQKVIKENTSKVKNLNNAVNNVLADSANKSAEISRYRGVIAEKTKDIKNLSGANGLKNLAKGVAKAGAGKVKSFFGRLTGSKNKNFE
jgi:hypothetical protein|nr:MAG TPA: hypothetical protein [Caudoviricetes sp.]